MSKIIRNVIVAVSATVGFIALLFAILTLLGVEIDIDCIPDCCKITKKPVTKEPAKAPTKIKRNYTEIKLPN